jgi:hypothetical protein
MYSYVFCSIAVTINVTSMGVVFLPGSYASFILFGAWMRWRGFTYDMIPSYDD